jgi:hypothetical protein
MQLPHSIGKTFRLILYLRLYFALDLAGSFWFEPLQMMSVISNAGRLHGDVERANLGKRILLFGEQCQ